MTTEWKDCSTLSELAAAVERGDEIEVAHVGNYPQIPWQGEIWYVDSRYYCRPREIEVREIEVPE